MVLARAWRSASTARSRSPASTSTCRPARSTACSGPTAPARPPPCPWRSACCDPTTGQAWVLGHDVWADPVAAKRLFGVLPDGVRLFDRLSGAELLAYNGLLRGMDPAVVDQRAAELLDVLALGRRRPHARRRLLRRHEEEDRPGLRAAARAPAAGARRAVRGGRPGLGGADPRHPPAVRRRRRHGGLLQPRDGGRRAALQRTSRSSPTAQIKRVGTLDEVRGERSLEDVFVEVVGGRTATGEELAWL